MCYCILKNDHNCRFMGFGLTREEKQAVDEIRAKYGGFANEKRSTLHLHGNLWSGEALW